MLADMVDDFVVEYYHNEADKVRCVSFAAPWYCTNREDLRTHSLPKLLGLSAAQQIPIYKRCEGLGVAIGNLFRQLFANFLLNVLDWYLIKSLGLQYAGRYVDDFYIVDKDKARLLAAVPLSATLLQLYGLTLHPHKFYFAAL
jgi:hypothetical protein